MTTGSSGAPLRQLGQLFESGTLTGLTDAQLLHRFLTRNDEAAFESLVRKHGPMVLSVCRRRLSDPNDVDDAFQATFLVLIRRAPDIQDATRLANWLYGVAHKVAERARLNARKRRDHEGKATPMPSEPDRRPPSTTSPPPSTTRSTPSPPATDPPSSSASSRAAPTRKPLASSAGPSAPSRAASPAPRTFSARDSPVAASPSPPP